MQGFSRIAFTPAVKATQEQMGSRQAYARLERGPATADAIGEDEAGFLAGRDSFYMASVGESGWPYIQHRGGVSGRPAHRSHGVERVRQGEDAIAADPAPGRLQAGEPVDPRGKADRTAGVGAQAGKAEAGGRGDPRSR